MSGQNKQQQGDRSAVQAVARPGTTVGQVGAVGSAPEATNPPPHPLDLSAPPRLRTADRQQLLSPLTIDDLLEPDHPARAVWRFAQGLDLSELYERIRARGSDPGRPAIDPRVLVALWLYATLASVKSARALADLCVHHDAYRWLAGGIAVNYHTLSDFRVDHLDFLQNLLDHSVEVLRQQGLVDLDRVAQDGMRVRASAGAASFRSRQTLERLLSEAQAKWQRLQQQRDAVADVATPENAASHRPAMEQARAESVTPQEVQASQARRAPPAGIAEAGAGTADLAAPDEVATNQGPAVGTPAPPPQAPASQGSLAHQAASAEPASQEPAAEQPHLSRQQSAALYRHARERVERLQQALARLPEMEAKKKAAQEELARKKAAGKKVSRKEEQNAKARVSSTDPQATVMKMANGGYNPAYNVEYSTACQGMVTVGVDVLTEGSDQGQLPPMLDQIEERFEQRPKEALVDGGVADHDDIEKVQSAEKPCKVYAPVPEPKKEGVDRYEAKKTDSQEVAEWRQRMGTEQAKKIYKQRGATAECVNAQARNRGMQQFLVRGLRKIKAIALWFAAVHNMARGFSLQPQPSG
jgi:transposase